MSFISDPFSSHFQGWSTWWIWQHSHVLFRRNSSFSEPGPIISHQLFKFQDASSVTSNAVDILKMTRVEPHIRKAVNAAAQGGSKHSKMNFPKRLFLCSIPRGHHYQVSPKSQGLSKSVTLLLVVCRDCKQRTMAFFTLTFADLAAASLTLFKNGAWVTMYFASEAFNCVHNSPKKIRRNLTSNHFGESLFWVLDELVGSLLTLRGPTSRKDWFIPFIFSWTQFYLVVEQFTASWVPFFTLQWEKCSPLSYFSCLQCRVGCKSLWLLQWLPRRETQSDTPDSWGLIRTRHLPFWIRAEGNHYPLLWPME